jgi:hypothetical protein
MTDTLNELQLSELRKLPGFERGHPHYYEQPVIDHLLEIVLQLGAEIWVNRDRQLIMEYLLATRGSVTAAAIDAFEPDAEFKQKLQTQRKAFTERVYGCLYAGLDNTSASEFKPGVLSKKDV